MTGQGRAHLEEDIRLEERCRERARIVHELHDTLLQGFLGASMMLDEAVEQTPADSSSMPALSRALRVVRRAIDEGRAGLRGVHTASPAPSSLEQAFSNLLTEITTVRGPRLRIFVHGKPWTLDPAIQEQLFLIGREAVMNALRHSQATKIEVEFNTCATSCAYSFVTTAAESIPKAFKERAIRTGVFAGCVSARKISVRDSVYGAGPAPGQKCASPFRLTSRNRQPMIAILGREERDMMSANCIRVLSVDDHPLVREGVATIINNLADMSLAGTASTGRQSSEPTRSASLTACRGGPPE